MDKNGDHFFMPASQKYDKIDICFEQLSPLGDILENFRFWLSWVIIGHFSGNTGPILNLSIMEAKINETNNSL